MQACGLVNDHLERCAVRDDGRGGETATGLTASKIRAVAEAVSRESVSARIAQIREGLTLLADYL